MISPKDLDKLDTPEGRKQLPPEFVEEFSNGKGDDDDDVKKGGTKKNG